MSDTCSIVFRMHTHEDFTPSISRPNPADSASAGDIRAATELWLETIATSLGDTSNPAHVLEMLSMVERAINQARALTAGAIRALDRPEVWSAFGASSAVDLLRDRLRIRRTEAGSRLRIAKICSETNPDQRRQAACGLIDGRISQDHAVVIERALRKIPKPATLDQRRLFEVDLVNMAHGADPLECEKYANARLTDMKQEDPPAKRPNGRRSLTFRQRPDGMTELRVVLDADGEATLRAALDRLASAKGITPARGRRPLTVRRADALVQVCGQVLRDTVRPFGRTPRRSGAGPSDSRPLRRSGAAGHRRQRHAGRPVGVPAPDRTRASAARPSSRNGR